MNCADRGFTHVYRGNLECLICHHPKPRHKNELGLPCVKCGVTMTERNSYTVGEERDRGRCELRCKYCHSRRNNKRGGALKAKHK